MFDYKLLNEVERQRALATAQIKVALSSLLESLLPLEASGDAKLEAVKLQVSVFSDHLRGHPDRTPAGEVLTKCSDAVCSVSLVVKLKMLHGDVEVSI